MTHDSGAHAHDVSSALRALVRTASLTRPGVVRRAARRAAVVDLLTAGLQLPIAERRQLLAAAIATDIGAALYETSAVDGAARTAQLLTQLDLGLEPAAEVLRSRLERPDGEGLPNALLDDDIPFGSRVLAVADVLVRDADTDGDIDWSRRLEMMKDGAGTAFDLAITDLSADIFADRTNRRSVDAANLDGALARLGGAEPRPSALGSVSTVLASLHESNEFIDAMLDTVVVDPRVHSVGVRRFEGQTSTVLAARGTVPDISLAPAPSQTVRQLNDDDAPPAVSEVWVADDLLAGPVALATIIDSNGRPWGAVWVVAGKAERIEASQSLAVDLAAAIESHLRRLAAIDHLEDLAHHDQLTGLANRWHLESRLHRLFAAGPDARSDAALIMCDVDRLKIVNDTLGHAAGDEVLRAVAAAIDRVTDRYDAVGCRLGGDEFCILILSGALLHAADAARAVATEVRVSAPAGVGLSCGIAYAAHVDDPGVLLASADQAQYTVKRRRPADQPSIDPVRDRRSHRRT